MKKRQKKKYCISYICGISKIKQTSECNKRAESQTQRLVSSSEEREGGARQGREWEIQPLGVR